MVVGIRYEGHEPLPRMALVAIFALYVALVAVSRGFSQGGQDYLVGVRKTLPVHSLRKKFGRRH